MMKRQLFVKDIYVKPSIRHGYGVFAGEDIQAGETVEECHVLPVGTEDVALMDYYFSDGKETKLVALGYGSIYNHADDENTDYAYDFDAQLMIYKARKNIRKGEEILINYGKAWLETRNIRLNEPPLRKRILNYCKGMPLRALLVCGIVVLLSHLLPK